MTQEEFIILAGKIADGTASESEITQYNAYFNAYQARYPSWEGLPEELKAQMLAETKEGIDGYLQPEARPKVQRLWPKVAIAAAAVAAILFGLWFFNAPHPSEENSAVLASAQQDIAPGKQGATLTVGNGKVVELSNQKNGVVISTGKLSYDDGSVVDQELNAFDQDAKNEVMLSARTAKGQTYQVTLQDGTRVWLNADSKIEFPSQFNGAERKIILSGEGYFEVAKDKAHPFIVKTGNQEVTVLGTHFNISSYSDDAVTTTTLLEGSVKVSAFDAAAGRRNVILKPSQQAIQNPNGGMQVREVDVADAVDWKNGDFIFKRETLASIMNRVARWYNVQVVYDPDVDKLQAFGGKVSRSKNISEVLKIMQSTGQVRFKITGDQIRISN